MEQVEQVEQVKEPWQVTVVKKCLDRVCALLDVDSVHIQADRALFRIKANGGIIGVWHVLLPEHINDEEFPSFMAWHVMSEYRKARKQKKVSVQVYAAHMYPESLVYTILRIGEE